MRFWYDVQDVCAKTPIFPPPRAFLVWVVSDGIFQKTFGTTKSYRTSFHFYVENDWIFFFFLGESQLREQRSSDFSTWSFGKPNLRVYRHSGKGK